MRHHRAGKAGAGDEAGLAVADEMELLFHGALVLAAVARHLLHRHLLALRVRSEDALELIAESL